MNTDTLLTLKLALEWIEEAKRTGTSLPANNTIIALKEAIKANGGVS